MSESTKLFGKCVLYPFHQVGWSLTPQSQRDHEHRCKEKRETLPRSHFKMRQMKQIWQITAVRQNTTHFFAHIHVATVRKAAPPELQVASCPPAAGHNCTQAVQISRKSGGAAKGGIGRCAKNPFLSGQGLHLGC